MGQKGEMGRRVELNNCTWVKSCVREVGVWSNYTLDRCVVEPEEVSAPSVGY